MKGALRALAPGLIVLTATVATLAWAREDAGGIAEDYALVAFGAGLALSWVFHRSRAFIVLGLLIWLDIRAVGPDAAQDLFLGLATVVVGLMGLLGLVRDRGVRSRVGALQVVVMSAIALGAGFLLEETSPFSEFIPAPVISQLTALVWPGYPRVTLLVAGASFLTVLWSHYRYRGELERAFLWAGGFLVVAMHPALDATDSALFLMAAGLTVTLAIVEASYVMAYRDDLTGLLGRRALMRYLDDIKGVYTIAMVDVDHFKKFNDRHGHDVGDQVLKLVAGRLAAAPGGAKAYRYGGEEFALIYPGRTRDDALQHLETVRESIEASRFSVRSWQRPRKKPEGQPKKQPRKPRQLSVTVSIGMADTTASHSEPADILKKADKALYRAKNKGRNQVSK